MPRPKIKINEQELNRLVVHENWSMTDVAEKFGHSRMAVTDYAKSLGYEWVGNKWVGPSGTSGDNLLTGKPNKLDEFETMFGDIIEAELLAGTLVKDIAAIIGFSTSYTNARIKELGWRKVWVVDPDADVQEPVSYTGDSLDYQTIYNFFVKNNGKTTQFAKDHNMTRQNVSLILKKVGIVNVWRRFKS